VREVSGDTGARLLALLAEAERHNAVVAASAYPSVAGFLLGAAVGLLLGRTDPRWADAAVEEVVALLAAQDGRPPTAHLANLRAMAHRLVAEAAATECDRPA
jgi:hypothetical protein